METKSVYAVLAFWKNGVYEHLEPNVFLLSISNNSILFYGYYNLLSDAKWIEV